MDLDRLELFRVIVGAFAQVNKHLDSTVQCCHQADIVSDTREAPKSHTQWQTYQHNWS